MMFALVVALLSLAPVAASAAEVAQEGAAEAAIAAPTFTSVPGFVSTGSAVISGTKLADASVTLIVGGVDTILIPASSATTWSRSVVAPNGAGITLSATQAVGSDVSPAATASFDALGPPSLSGSGVSVGTGAVSGQGFPGSVITITAGTPPNGAPFTACSNVLTDGSGYFSCSLSPTTGTYTVRAQQSNAAIGGGQSSGLSSPQTITIDREAPAAPVITAPSAGTRLTATSVAVTGTGEDAGLIDVYLNNVPVCSATVAQGGWSCTASGFRAGDNTLRAIQRDAAGNYGPPGVEIGVVFGQAAATPTPSIRPTPTPSATPAPTPEATPTTPAPEPLQPSDPAEPAPVPAPLPPPDGGSGTSNWGSPTTFGSQLATVGESVLRGNWAMAPLFGLAFLLLVAVPLRLLVSVTKGRFRMPRISLTGRNQVVPHEVDPAPRNPWMVGGIAIAVCTGMVLLTVGVEDEVRFLRLFAAVGVALVFINLVSIVVMRAVGVATRSTPILRFLPLMLVAAVVTAALSGTVGLTPPLVTGALLGAGFAGREPVRARGLVNLAPIAALTVVGVLAWFGHSAAASPSGFWQTFVHELLAAACIAGLGSALVMLLPLAALPGRVLLEWSPVIWATTLAVVASVTCGVLLGGASADFPVMPALFAAAAFGILSVAVWAYLRYVEPELR